MKPNYKILWLIALLWGQTVWADGANHGAIPLPDLKNVVTEPKHDMQTDAGGKNDDEKKVTDGSRFNLKQKGFSFIPPKGWERVQTNSGLLFQMQKDPHVNYQKTLQVLFFNGSVSWDNYSLTNFGKLLAERFSKRSNLMAEYKVLNMAAFPLDQGSSAQAYYTTFLYGAMPMMQLHVLVSNSSRHVLVTFTDLAGNFKSDAVPEDHRPVYDALKSIELDGSSGMSSFDKIKYIVAFGVAAIVLFFLFRTSVSWLRFRQLRKIDLLPADQHINDKADSDYQRLDEADALMKKNDDHTHKDDASDHGLEFNEDHNRDDQQSVA